VVCASMGRGRPGRACRSARAWAIAPAEQETTMTNPPPRGGPIPWGQQPGYGHPEYGHPGYGQPRAAPAPGAVPLRPLGVGDVLSGSFALVRQNPAATLGLTASTVTALAICLAIIFFVASRTAPGVAFLAAPIVLLFFGVQLGGLVSAMGRNLLGHRVTIREALRRSRPGWVILAALALAVPFIAGWSILVGTLKGWGAALALLLTAWLAVMVSLTIPVVVLERRNPFAAIGRSWRLIFGSYWRVFGIYVLMYVIMWALSFVVSLPLDVITGLADSIGARDGRVTITLTLAILAIGEIVIASLALTIETGVVVLVYADMRMRKEGMDLVLQQAAMSYQLTGEEFAASGLSSAYAGGASHGGAYPVAYPGGAYPGGAYPGPYPGGPYPGGLYPGGGGASPRAPYTGGAAAEGPRDSPPTTT
jgi:hypothetical protein